MFPLLSILAVLSVGVQAVQFEIQNVEPGPVWVGIQGNPGHAHLANGGFILKQGERRTVNAADNWAGRFWGRTWCDSSSKCCQTGDCGCKVECHGAGGRPPATLLEITLRGAGGLDFYDISLVDGYNLRAYIQPIGGEGDGGKYSCKKAGCGVNLSDQCPNELKVKNRQGVTIACATACLVFNTDEYCCRGRFNTPATCKSSNWKVNYPKFFKDRCPDAYSYAYDDHKSTFTCKRVPKYVIAFGRG